MKMNNREKRKGIAEDTLRILEQGYFNNSKGERINIDALQAKAVEETKLYRPDHSDDLLLKIDSPTLNIPSKITVSGQTTLDATRNLIQEGYEDVICLNFASAKNPGGGFLGGSQAQEESLARSTGLYPCQQKAWDYYEVNRKTKSCIYTDHMIYSPYVSIIKDEEGNNLDELTYCAVITAPAVNTGVVKRKESKRIPEIEIVMKRRIRKVLAIALENNHRAIVLGAWGCGVFQNDPKDISSYFKEILNTDFKDKFERIEFAIYAKNERFINPFREAFKD